MTNNKLVALLAHVGGLLFQSFFFLLFHFLSRTVSTGFTHGPGCVIVVSVEHRKRMVGGNLFYPAGSGSGWRDWAL